MLGAEAILRLRRPVVAFEYDYYRTPQLYGFQHAAFLDFLDKLDYQFSMSLGFHSPPPTATSGKPHRFKASLYREKNGRTRTSCKRSPGGSLHSCMNSPNPDQ